MSGNDEDEGVRDVNEFINAPGKWAFAVVAGLLVAWFVFQVVTG